MADRHLPLSGAVTQTFNAWNNMLRSVSGQLGLININIGRTSDPALEAELVSEVASYGRQLGRISDALAVLIARLPPETELPAREQAALDDFKRLINELAAVKDRHARPGKPRALRFRSWLGDRLVSGDKEDHGRETSER